MSIAIVKITMNSSYVLIGSHPFYRIERMTARLPGSPVKYIINDYKKAKNLISRFSAILMICLFFFLKPIRGFEPLTYALRVRCSTY